MSQFFTFPINPFAFFIWQTAPLFASRILKGDPQTKGEIIKGLGNKIIEFLEAATESKKGSIALDTNLIDSGLVDSMNIMALIVFLEEQTGKPIPLEDLDISFFNNVASIAN